MALAKIVYASMTGNTEEIADIVAKKLEELGHTVDVDECTTVDAADFEDADIPIMLSYIGDNDDVIATYQDLAETYSITQPEFWQSTETDMMFIV